MFIITLKINADIKTYCITDFNNAIDFSIEHYKEFLSMRNKNLDTIYNKIDADGLGGYYLTLECERLG